MLYGLYKRYWETLATWADDCEFKREDRVTILAIPALIQIIMGGFFCMADSGYFPFMQRFKIQAKKKHPVEQDRLNDAIWVFVRNLVLGLFLSPIIVKITELRGNIYDANVPPLSHFLIIWPMVLIEDLWFYSTHRMLHTKMLYERIHKFHHKWTQPTAVSVFYMHPVEFIMAIVINIYIGFWVTGCHTAIFHAYLLVESCKGLMNHSGYAFIDVPCIIGNEFHDTHHRLTQCNYGSYGYVDVLFGSHRLVPKDAKIS